MKTSDELLRQICSEMLSESNKSSRSTDAEMLVELELLATKLQVVVLEAKRDGLFTTLWSVVR